MYTGTLINDLSRTVECAERSPFVNITFGARPELYDRIIETAKECQTSASALCRVAVAEYLERLEKAAQ